MGGGGGSKAKEATFIGVADFVLDLVKAKEVTFFGVADCVLDLVIVVFEMASLKDALRVLGVDIGKVFLDGVVLPLDGVSGFCWISGVVSPLDGVSWSSSASVACGVFAGDNLRLFSTSF